MSLGLFDIVGPVMHGPSSNHTGGANRIGFFARQIMGDLPKELTFAFHPIFMNFFQGQRSNVALMSGCLGFREDNELCNMSMKIAKEKGIQISYAAIQDPDASRDTMRVSGRTFGIDWVINGISIGAGNIIISNINGIDVHLDGNGNVTLFLLPKDEDGSQITDYVKTKYHDELKAVFSGRNDLHTLICLDAKIPLLPSDIEEIKKIQGNVIYSTKIDSMYPFADICSKPPLFSTYSEILSLSVDKSIIDVVVEYEMRRSGRTKDEIMAEALRIVDIITQSMERGLKGNNHLIGGLCTGNDGKLILDHSSDKNNICGYIFNVALARAVAMAEVNASAGRIVAAPTAGSAGTLPGTLFTVAERYGCNKEKLAEAFLIAAAIGVVIGRIASFSGGTTGCQSEVGVGAAMGAAGSVYLAGGTAEGIIHAAVLALKNVFGLSCDCPASPVELPCIKRNAMGVSVALMAAELALSGVRSVLPPDDIVIAFADTQKWMPTELCNANIGGLAATPHAKVLRAKWNSRLEELKKQELS